MDLRGANAKVEPVASSRPHLESGFQSVAGSQYFAKIDFAHAHVIYGPMAQMLHAVMPNKLPHFDFLFVYPGVEGYNHILVLKDDRSGYVMLLKRKATDAESTVDGLMSWFATFGVVLDRLSDQGKHVKNSVVELPRNVTALRTDFISQTPRGATEPSRL